MAKPLSVFVSIGAKIDSSLGRSISQTEKQFRGLEDRIRAGGAAMSLKAGGWGAIGTAGAAAFGAKRALGPFIEFEEKLSMLARTAEISASKMDAVGKRIVSTGLRFGVGGRAALDGAQNFMAAGLTLAQAEGALSPTLMLSKAGGVSVDDASAVGVAAMQNMAISTLQLSDAFEAMAKAGKLGNVELNEMARVMPGILSRASALGMTGVDGVARSAAMLEIARYTAPTGAEAGNNIENLLKALTANETKNRFSKQGLDVERFMKAAGARGEDPTFALIAELRKRTLGKDGKIDAFRLSEYIADAQAQSAALALTENFDKLQAFYRQSKAASGTLAKDFAEASKTTRFGLDRFAAGLERVGIALGRSFGPMLGDMAIRFANLTERFADWAEAHPTAIKFVGTLVGGLVAARAAVAGFGMLFGGVGGKIVQMVGWLAAKTAPMRIGFVALRTLGIVPLLAATWPLVAVLGGVGLALAFIAAKWNGIVGFFSGFKRGFADAVGPETMGNLAKLGGWISTLGNVLSPVTFLLKTVGDYLSQFFGPAETGRWASWGEIAGGAIGKVANMLSGFVNLVERAASATAKFFSSVGNGGNGRPKLAGARARGGPIESGRSYLVSEQGPEIVTPGRSGMVHTAAATKKALSQNAGSAGHTFIVNVHPPAGASGTEVAREVERAIARMARGQSALLSD